MYGLQYIKHDRQNFLSFCAIFCPFTPPFPLSNNPENQHFEKMEKTLEDIIIIHMNTINQNHVMYDF